MSRDRRWCTPPTTISGIYAADGEMAVIGVYLLVPIYTGYMAIKEFLGRFNDIEDGDVFIINDPYLAAEHQNDVQFCAPFFHDGKLVAWLGCMAHQVDLGGLDPGSWCPTATDVYQEGLRIPPGRIVRKGEINRQLSHGGDCLERFQRVPCRPQGRQAAARRTLRPLWRRDGCARDAAVDRGVGA